jgi:hypothetical protein
MSPVWIETQISRVLLHGARAYKVKKPLRLLQRAGVLRCAALALAGSGHTGGRCRRPAAAAAPPAPAVQR